MKNNKQPRGSVLVGSSLVILILTFVAGNYLVFVSSGSVGIKKMNDSCKAFYLAEAGLQRIYYEVNQTGGSNPVTAALGSGSYTASFDAANNVMTSTGTVGGISRTVAIDTVPIPPGVNGAITAQSDVSSTGSIVIDGRDHTITGALNGAPGTYGISTTGDYVQSGSSLVGGGGIAPANPADTSSFQENVSPTGSLPWEIMGVTEAWFNANIPAQSVPPPQNNSGVYYYDPGPDSSWIGVNFGVSSGILIVHNSTNNAVMKNLTGTFVGLIIADAVEHVTGNALIIGALVTTTQAGNAMGNGNAQILYSSQALVSAGTTYLPTADFTKEIKSGSWREL
jgi:hypothetical protein